MEAETPTLTPADLKAVLLRRKWSMAVPFAAIFLLAVIVALALPPIYKSTSTILIEQQDMPADFVKATVSTYAEQQLQIINQRIMSSTRLLDIISRFKLYEDLKDSEPTEEIIARMREDIKLEPISVDVVDPKTGRPAAATIAFSLSYEGKRDPQKVYQVANVLASLFLEENVVTRERQAGEVSRFLESELSRVKDDLTKIDNSIARFKEQHVSHMPELMQVNMQSMHDTERDLDLLHDRLAQLKEKEGYLKSQLANTPTEFREMDKQRLKDLKIQLVNLKQHFSEEHPDVKKAQSEIAELERQLKKEGANLEEGKDRPDNPAYITLSAELSSVQSEISSSEKQLADLKSRVSEYKSNLWATPQVENEYKGLLMQRGNLQAKYDDLMRKSMEAKVSQGLEKEQKGERFTIIDPARLPEEPYKPNRLAILLIGLVLSIGAGVGSGAVKEYSDKSVRNTEELTMITSFPVLASIPEIQATGAGSLRIKHVVMIMSGMVIAAVVLLAAFHFLVMDLDIFWVKLLRWIG